MIRAGANGLVFNHCWILRNRNLKFNINRHNHQEIGWQSLLWKIIIILFVFLFLTGVLFKFLNSLTFGCFVFSCLTRSSIQEQKLQSSYHVVVTLFQYLSGTIFIPTEQTCPHSTLPLYASKTLDAALDTVNINLFFKHHKAYCQKIILQHRLSQPEWDTCQYQSLLE